MVDRKVAVIFGSTGGIGRAITTKFMENGYNVGLFARSQKATNDERVISCAGDATVEQEVEDFIVSVLNKWNGIDILVFSIGIMHVGPAVSSGYKYMEVFANNVISFVNTIRSYTKYIIKPSKVVVIGSMRDYIPGKDKAAYCSSKAALKSIIDCVEKEHHELKIIHIRPGFVNTGLHKENSMVPFKDGKPVEVVQPDDIANVVWSMCNLSTGSYPIELKIGNILGERNDIEWRKR